MSDRFQPEPGRNCWRVERAERAAVVIDGAAYFRALRECCARARSAITLVGWEIDGRIDLLRDDRPTEDERPRDLGGFLDSLVRTRPDLTVRVLAWDFTWIYALERDWLTPVRLGWTTSDRLIYRTDAKHPVGASHHQKIVVVDDAVAFTGGIDLGPRRWDTPEHAADQPGRRDPSGEPYPPHHDVQLAVSGDAARALGELVRERWRRATGERIEPPPEPDDDRWPESLSPEFRNVRAAIARTEPEYRGRPEVREIERMFDDTFAAARDTIYIENQYLTSRNVARRLADRLSSEDGPEVVVVVPQRTDGWLERNTMDVLRARVVEQLRSADAHGRLRVLRPQVPGLGDQRANVHAKVTIVDDRVLRVGSANLSNRSMGLDTECDLALVACDDAERETVLDVRDRLLSEHLGTDAKNVADARRDRGGLTGAIDALRTDRGRTLVPLDPDPGGSLGDRLVSDSDWLDPERPVDVSDFLGRIVGRDVTGPGRTRDDRAS